MRRLAVAVLFPALLHVLVAPPEVSAQGRFDPRREARFMVDANLAYTFISGDVGDSLSGGPGVELAGLYQLASVPLRVGAGAGYSRHGIQDQDASADRYDVFAAAELLLFSEETEMIPYVQGRVGWMQISNSLDGIDTRVSGLELGALVGVDMPVAEKISIDVSGQFSWFTGGDLYVEGVSLSDTSRSGSVFAIRAGAFFFF